MKHASLQKLSAMLLAILLFNTALINSASSQEPLGTKTATFPPAHDAQLVQDSLYILLEDKLVSLATDQTEWAAIFSFSEYPDLNWYSTLLFSDNASLYLLDSLTQAVYRLDGTKLEPLVTLDISKLAKTPDNGSQNVAFECPIIQDGFLYALCTEFTHDSKGLYRFSLESGEGSEISISGSMFQEIVSYRDGQLLGLDYNTRTLVAIDAATGKAVDVLGTTSGYSVGAIAYDSVNDTVYSLCDAEVVQWIGGKPVTIGYLPTGAASDAIYVGMWSNQYTFVDSTGIYACDTVAQAGRMRPLTIWSEVGGLLNSKLISGFMLLYPQTPVIVRGTAGENPQEKISTVNMTRDTSVDIFAVTSQRTDAKKIFSRGYAAGLNSAVLEADVLSMYPQIRDYFICDGSLFGFPAQLWPKYWTVCPELLEESQLGAVPKFLNEYYDMMLLWYEENHNLNPAFGFHANQTVREEWLEAIYSLSSQYVCAYASKDKPLSFNTPAFRVLLEKVASLSKWKGEKGSYGYGSDIIKSIFQTSSLDPFVQSLNPEDRKKEYILPPAFAKDGQPFLNATMVYFIVNPYSQNQEAAIRFLEFFSRNMELTLKYKLHPNYNEPVERKEYPSIVQAHEDNIAAIKSRMAAVEDEGILLSLKEELAQEEALLAQQRENRWEYSADVIAEYRRLAPYLSIEHDSFLWDLYDKLNIEAILMKYFEGQVTLDQALSELDRKVSLLFLESQ